MSMGAVCLLERAPDCEKRDSWDDGGFICEPCRRWLAAHEEELARLRALVRDAARLFSEGVACIESNGSPSLNADEEALAKRFADAAAALIAHRKDDSASAAVERDREEMRHKVGRR